MKAICLGCLALCALAMASCGGRKTVDTLPKAKAPEEAAQESLARHKPSTPQPSRRDLGKTRAANQMEQRIIDRLASAAESVRGLRFVNAVRVEVENKAAITHSLLGQLEEEDLGRAKTIYTALGLLPKEVDLELLLVEVLGEQVVGYYDPKTHRLVVRDDVMAGLQAERQTGDLEETKLVLIHELVHALQDQKLKLGDAYDKERDSDAENAFRSVVEGDATLAMMAHALRGQGLPLSLLTRSMPELGALIQTDSLLSGQQLTKAPAILRVTLVAPYLRGLELTATMHAQGGWRAVDNLHRKPPISSEQVLHPQKYIRNERPDRIRVPKFKAMKRAGYELVQEDTLGELELAVYFGQGTPTEYDADAASGWSGDRLRVYSRGESNAVVWFSAWDSTLEAEQAAHAAKRVAKAIHNAVVKRDGRALLILRGVPDLLQPEIIEAFSKMADRLVTRRNVE